MYRTVQDHFADNFGLKYVVFVNRKGDPFLILKEIHEWCNNHIGPSVYRDQNLWYVNFVRVHLNRSDPLCSEIDGAFGGDFLYAGFLLEKWKKRFLNDFGKNN